MGDFRIPPDVATYLDSCRDELLRGPISDERRENILSVAIGLGLSSVNARDLLEQHIGNLRQSARNLQQLEVGPTTLELAPKSAANPDTARVGAELRAFMDEFRRRAADPSERSAMIAALAAYGEGSNAMQALLSHLITIEELKGDPAGDELLTYVRASADHAAAALGSVGRGCLQIPVAPPSDADRAQMPAMAASFFAQRAEAAMEASSKLPPVQGRALLRVAAFDSAVARALEPEKAPDPLSLTSQNGEIVGRVLEAPFELVKRALSDAGCQIRVLGAVNPMITAARAPVGAWAADDLQDLFRQYGLEVATLGKSPSGAWIILLRQPNHPSWRPQDFPPAPSAVVAGGSSTGDAREVRERDVKDLLAVLRSWEKARR